MLNPLKRRPPMTDAIEAAAVLNVLARLKERACR